MSLVYDANYAFVPCQLTPGVHFILPFVERPKTYSWRFLLSQNGRTTRVSKVGQTRIPTKNEVRATRRRFHVCVAGG